MVPLVVQMAVELLVKITARLEVAVAVAVVVPPTASGVGPKLMGLLMVCATLAATAIVVVTGVAGQKLPPPG